MRKKKNINPEDIINDDEAFLELENDLIIDELEKEEFEDDFYHDVEEIEDDVEELLEEEIVPEIKKKLKIDKTKFYIQPKDFDVEIMKYYSSGVLTNELAVMVDKIAQKLSYAPNFINYSFRDEMVGDAIVKMMKALIGKKYTHNKGSNPFSYFTRVAFNAFICRIKKEKHSQEIHEKYKEELLTISDNYNIIKKNKNIKISNDREEL